TADSSLEFEIWLFIGAWMLEFGAFFRALPATKSTIIKMSDAYNQLLDATIQHLQGLKDRGVRFVEVSPEKLANLTQAPRPAASRPAPKPASMAPPAAIPQTMAAPTVVVSDAKSAAFAELRARAMACVKCPHLASSRKNVVFGVGNMNAS